MMNDVSAANGIRTPSARGFVAHPGVELLLQRREKISGGGVPIWDGDSIGGRRAVSSNDVPSGTLLYGDWSSVMVVNWGTLEVGLTRSGSSSDFVQGKVSIRAVVTCDVVVRYPASSPRPRPSLDPSVASFAEAANKSPREEVSMIEVRIVRKMQVHGRLALPGLVLALNPRDALDACCGGRAEPVNREAYLKACAVLSNQALRGAGLTPDSHWPRVT